MSSRTGPEGKGQLNFYDLVPSTTETKINPNVGESPQSADPIAGAKVRFRRRMARSSVNSAWKAVLPDQPGQLGLEQAPVVNSVESLSAAQTKGSRKTFVELAPKAMAAHIKAGRLGPNGESVGTIRLEVTDTIPSEKDTKPQRPTLPSLPDVDVSPEDDDLDSAEAEKVGPWAYRLTHARRDR